MPVATPTAGKLREPRARTRPPPLASRPHRTPFHLAPSRPCLCSDEVKAARQRKTKEVAEEHLSKTKERAAAAPGAGARARAAISLPNKILFIEVCVRVFLGGGAAWAAAGLPPRVATAPTATAAAAVRALGAAGALRRLPGPLL